MIGSKNIKGFGDECYGNIKKCGGWLLMVYNDIENSIKRFKK
jgi:hypothetical protein